MDKPFLFKTRKLLENNDEPLGNSWRDNKFICIVVYIKHINNKGAVNNGKN